MAVDATKKLAGGGVMAASGHNAAQRILKDRRRAGLRKRFSRASA